MKLLVCCFETLELLTTAWLSSSGGSEAASVAFILLQNLGLQHGIIIKAQEAVKDGMSLAGAAGKEIDQWAQGNYGEPVKDWWEGKHGNPVADWWGGKFGNPVSQWAEAVMQKGRQA